MPIPTPASPEEEEEQLAEAIARSLALAPTAASAGTVNVTVLTAATVAVSQYNQAPAVHPVLRCWPKGKASSASSVELEHEVFGPGPEPEPPTAAAAALPAPQDGALHEAVRGSLAALPARYYICWRLPLHPLVHGVVVSVEPGAWERFARVCLGRTTPYGSGADFCGGRRITSLAQAERIYLARWRNRQNGPASPTPEPPSCHRPRLYRLG